MVECIASFLNLVIICSIHSMVSNDPDMPYSMAQVYTGVVSGLGVMTISTIFLPISGAHINPAISIAATVAGRISHTRAMAYISAQACGAVAGAATVIGLDSSSHQLTETKISDLGLEMILSFLLTMVYLSVIKSTERGKANNPEVTIGLAYAACLSAARVTLNPAAALGLSFMNKNYNNHWVEWVGPIIGGVAAGFCHWIIKRYEDDLGKRELSEEGFDDNTDLLTGRDCTMQWTI
jgi:glycerol uptake facilitator-like aquaporin